MSFKKLKKLTTPPDSGDSFFESLRKALPAVFPRKDLPRYIGSLISVGYMANLDSSGQGPESRRIGGNIVYERDSFILWLISRMEEM